MNRFQHVDLRVRDLAEAIDFYSKLLPALGFHREESSPAWTVFQAEGDPAMAPWFAFTPDPDHRPNANRIAFRGDSREEVDRLAALALEAGARNMSGPRACPEYSPTYYAAFFDDPSGNPLEICHTTT